MKITITRLLETSKALATEAGKQLADPITYLSELAEQTVRSLRNGLTFSDNFDATIATVALKHNTAALVAASKSVTGIIPTRTFSSRYPLDSFTWYVDEANRVTVKAGFVGSPAAAINVSLLILY